MNGIYYPRNHGTIGEGESGKLRRRNAWVVESLVVLIFVLVGSFLPTMILSSAVSSSSTSSPSALNFPSHNPTTLGPANVYGSAKAHKDLGTRSGPPPQDAPGSTCNSSTPCQMGVSDFGCTGTCVTFNTAYWASGVADTTYFNRLYMDGCGTSTGCGLGDQLNAVAENMWTCGSSACNNDQYWTQNVIQLTQSGPLTYTANMLDNIWNFTTTFSTLNSVGLLHSTCGGIATASDGENYQVCSTSSFTVEVPFWVNTWMYAETDPSGNAEVLFYAVVLSGPSESFVFSGLYDNVTFNSRGVASTLNTCSTVSNPNHYECYVIGGINGYGTYDSLENDIVGIANGYTVRVPAIQADLSIAYETTPPPSGSGFVYAPHAYSSGYDTAETSSNTMSTPTGCTPGNFVTAPINGGCLVESGEDSTIQLY